MTPDESQETANKLVAELLDSCPANYGGPHRWRASAASSSVAPTVRDRMGRVRSDGPMRVRVNVTAQCICGVEVRASKDAIAPGRAA